MEHEKYSLEQRICLYDGFVKSSSAKKAQKIFREKYPGEIIPSKSDIQKLVNNVRAKGKLLELKKRPSRVMRTEAINSKHKTGSSKSAVRTASKLLELQLKAIREKMLADANPDDGEISIKSETVWMGESESSASGDSEDSEQEMIENVKEEYSESSQQEVITDGIKKEPEVTLVEDPTFVSVKQEPEEFEDPLAVENKEGENITEEFTIKHESSSENDE